MYSRFVIPEITEKSMIFEVFTSVQDENDALYAMQNIELSTKEKTKQMVSDILGKTVVNNVKKIIK